jgi:L-malate glycosyltransferase
MKIAIVCYPVKGGSGVVASELGIGLSRRGCEVHFFSYELPFRLSTYESNFFFHEVDISQYPLFKYPPYTITLAAKLVDESINFRFDLIHAHYAIPHAAAAFLAAQSLKDKAPKIITTLHGTDITLIGQDKSFYPITKFSIEASDGVTAISKFLEAETHKVFKTDKHIEVIPNFVDTDRFSPGENECSRSLFVNPNQKIIMHMSNYRPVKNSLHVIDIFNIIQSKLPSKLILVGDGPETGNVMNRVRELGLSDRVIFLGNQDRVHNILPIADLFLLPSGNESFGLAALEALSCGVPAVTSDIGGLPELIMNDVNGFHCPVGDIEAMAERSLQILTDDNLRKRLSENARRMVVEKYKIDDIIGQYLAFYEKVLHG